MILGALRRERAGLAADDLRHLGVGRHLQRGADRAGVDRAEDGDRLVVERALHGGARLAGIARGVDELELDLLAEDAARGVDLVDRHARAVLPHGADGGAAAATAR